MFGISGIELFIILAVAFLIFGPEEMPRIGRIIGQALRMFNDARQEVESVIKTEMLNDENVDLFNDPLGMKSMKSELETTMKNIADPTYKPPPKGAGMRVSTDDALAASSVNAASTVSDSAATEPTDSTAQDGASAAVADAANADAGAQSLPSDVDPTDAASIWGITATQGGDDAC